MWAHDERPGVNRLFARSAPVHILFLLLLHLRMPLLPVLRPRLGIIHVVSIDE
jgi:hypothetical protein